MAMYPITARNSTYILTDVSCVGRCFVQFKPDIDDLRSQPRTHALVHRVRTGKVGERQGRKRNWHEATAANQRLRGERKKYGRPRDLLGNGPAANHPSAFKRS